MPARSSSSRPRTCSARWPRRRRPGQVLVGFAAEHGEGAVAYGRGKLERKRLDAIVVNDISRAGIGFDSDRERGHDRDRATDGAAGAASQQGEVARAVLDEVERARVSEGGARMEPPSRRRVAPHESEARRRARAAAGGERRARGPGPRRDARAPAGRAAGRGPRAGRGLPGRRQDGAGPRARPLDRLPVRARAVHLGPAARPTSSAPTSTTSASSASSSGPARCSPTSCSSTRSTAPRRRRSRACSSACRSAASPSTCTPTSSRGRSSCSPRRTRSSTRAPTRCPRRRSTASWSGSRSAIPTARAEAGMLADHEAGDRVLTLEPVATAAEVLAAQDAAAPRARRRGAARLRRAPALAHPRGPARRARRQPARRADAAARGEGARDDAGPRPRAARRRPGARRAGARPPPRARARSRRGARPRDVVADAVASVRAL